jgi:hypothetical protein
MCELHIYAERCRSMIIIKKNYRHMKKIIVLFTIFIVFLACSKEQRAVNKLEGTWLATSVEVVAGGEIIISADDEFKTVLEVRFDDCKLSNDKGCETFWVTSFPGNTNYAFDYAVSDDGKTLQMESWSSLTYSDRTYQILELVKGQLKLRSGDSMDYSTYTFVKE